MAVNDPKGDEPDAGAGAIPDSLEQFWANILSEAPETVRDAWAPLTEDEKRAVYDHLGRMANEEGWHPSQRDAARAALQAIGPFSPTSED
jgi:hypothetical protein